MAKFERRVRVDLDSYESKWKDCYIVVALLTFNAANEYDKHNRQLARKVTKLESISDPTPEQEQELDELNEKFRTRMIRAIAGQFKEGKIFDQEQDQIVDLSADDIGDFDFEILTALTNIISGKVSDKKK